MKLIDTIPILQISIAIDLAYLALDRFRHNKVITGLLEDYIQTAGKVGAKNAHARIDTTLTEYGEQLNNIRNPNLGYSWDIWVIGILTVIQIIILYYTALNADPTLVALNADPDPKLNYDWYILHSIPILTIVAMILPISMVGWLNLKVNRLKADLDHNKGVYKKTYKENINTLQDKLSKVKSKQN